MIPFDSTIGYVRVKGNYHDPTQILDYIYSIRNQIQQTDKPNLKGWIVDLRGNHGGKIWPMTTGIASIIGQIQHQ